jgi:hypothetical protein
MPQYRIAVFLLTASVGISGGAAPAWADVFRFIDEKGTIHFTDHLPARNKYQTVKLPEVPKKSGVRPSSKSNGAPISQAVNPNPVKFNVADKSKYGHHIQRISGKYSIDPLLVHSIVRVESDFKPRAVSPKGAMGLMQLMPETARLYRVRNVFDPEENIEGGVRFLSHLMKTYNRDLTLVLAAYNAGETAVNRYNGVPPFSETREYIYKVMREHRRVREELWSRPAGGEIQPVSAPYPTRPKVYRYKGEDGSYVLSDKPGQNL